jgi:CheY-like chemotaxis protein
MTDGTPSTAHGDSQRLRQILSTLLTNAVRRTHAGEVTVSVSARLLPPDRHELQFVVRDTGIAIPTDRAGRLFQPLSRIVAGSRVADAQDLGLAVSHGLAQLMGGNLVQRSEAGGGSTFELTIVLETPDRLLESAITRRPDPVPSMPVRPLRILLAEDSAVGRTVAVGVLERLGHAVDVVGDGVEVLEALERDAYDVILMDMHMPNMDGITATRLVCERWSRDRRPRIIALSASELPEDRARWLSAGADGWVSKSLPIDDIRRVLAGTTASRPGPARMPSRHAVPDKPPDPSDMAFHVMEIFLRDASSQMLALREAVAARDTTTIERVAHTMKGSAAMLGATSVARSCAELIQSARLGSLNDGTAMLDRLESNVAALQQTLAPRAH